MSGLSDIKSVDWWLDQWGEWSRTQIGVRLKYPSLTPFERLRAKSSSSVAITHDEAAEVDAAISSLRMTKRIEHDVLREHYHRGRTYDEIARGQRKRYSDILAIAKCARASISEILFPHA